MCFSLLFHTNDGTAQAYDLDKLIVLQPRALQRTAYADRSTCKVRHNSGVEVAKEQ
jgi:hypothetical protein